MARKRVIVGYNDSPEGRDALALARLLAGALEAAVVATVIVHDPRPASKRGDAALEEFCEPMFAAARELLGDDLQILERASAGPSPARALHDLAEEDDMNAAAIVIGSARHGPIGRVLLGSVGGSLLSGVRSAIAVAPRGYAEGSPGLGLVGVGVDGSTESLRALHTAITVVRDAGGELRIITVAEPHHYALGGSLSRLGREDYERFKEEEVERLVAQALGEVPEGVAASSKVLHGAPAESLAEEAAELDLLVLGSRSYGPVRSALLGSVSAKLMGSAPCAVLVLPREAGADPFSD